MTTYDGDQGELLFRFRAGTLEVDQARGEVCCRGEPLALEPKPLALLQALIEQPGQVISRPELLQRLWGRQEHLSENVLANAVLRLRKTLGPELGALIRNVAGQGYMFDAHVERVAVGRRFESRFELKPGVAVPGRETFLLDTPLGSSALSEVWLARHAKTRERRVYKFCSDGDRLAALKREFTLFRVLRESLGEREDWARVLDANFATPPFWLECEYGGESLPVWAVGEGQLAAMSLDDRVGLFIGIARSVADAHGLGVLHKDLKPANVLVAPVPGAAPCGKTGALQGAFASRWITRITDFGSGRLLNPELLARLGVTQQGMTMADAASDLGSGTLMYLAPELREGATPNVQSDLYALGLMLYQVVVGDLRRAMATGWERDIGDELLREDVALATQGRPEDRLKSVADLLERLQTRKQRRIQQKQISEQLRVAEAADAALRRASARRPWLIALSVALLTGLAATSWAWRDAARQREAAQLATGRAEAIQAFLNDDVLGGANPFAAKSAEPQTVKGALLRAAERVDGRFAAHPSARGEVHAALALLLQNYQEQAAANREWGKAVLDLRQAYGPHDARTVGVMYRSAAGLSRAGDAKAAEALLREADAAAAAGASKDATVALLGHYAHGSAMLDLSRSADAVSHMERAVAIAKAAPQLPVSLRDAAADQLSNAYYVAGRYKEGAEFASQWVAGLQARAEVPALLLASAKRRLAVLLMNDNRVEEAKPLLNQAILVFVAGLGAKALETVMTRTQLCMLAEASGMLDDAQRCWLDLLVVADAAPEVPPRILAGIRMNLGISYYMQQRDEQALRWLNEAIGRLLAMPGGEGYRHVSEYYAACAEARLGRAAAALRRLDGLDAAVLSAADPAVPWGLRLRMLKGVALAKQGDTVRARPLLESVMAQVEATTTEQGEGVFGMAKHALRQMNEAERLP